MKMMIILIVYSLLVLYLIIYVVYLFISLLIVSTTFSSLLSSIKLLPFILKYISAAYCLYNVK